MRIRLSLVIIFLGLAVVHTAHAQSIEIVPITPELNDDQAEAARDLEFWRNIKDSKNPALFEAYLAQFPNGAFRALAESELAALQTSSPKPTQSAGGFETRNRVREAQELLNAAGYGAGPEDGVAGANTRGAIRAFESAAGLPVDGLLDASSLSALRARVSDEDLAAYRATKTTRPASGGSSGTTGSSGSGGTINTPTPQPSNTGIDAFCRRSFSGLSDGSEGTDAHVNCITLAQASDRMIIATFHIGRIGSRIRTETRQLRRKPDGKYTDSRGNTYIISSDRIRYNDRANNDKIFHTMIATTMNTQ